MVNPSEVIDEHDHGASYHVHVNTYAKSEGLEMTLARFGLRSDPFLPLPHSYAPPFHFSLETESFEAAEVAWLGAVGAVDADDAFQGYVEMETISGSFSQEFPRRPFNEAKGRDQQPAPFELVVVPAGLHKRSDLHVKRSASYPHDRLDEIMLDLGFYEVQTERNRIYTLQLAAVSDARRAFDGLTKWLAATGGADRVTFEVVRRLHRKPANHALPLYVPRTASAGDAARGADDVS